MVMVRLACPSSSSVSMVLCSQWCNLCCCMSAASNPKGHLQKHWANFLHCVRTRQEPISDVHTHMQMLNVCHLAGISARFGRELKWDDNAQQIVGDDEANGFLARPYRSGYEIEMNQTVNS